MSSSTTADTSTPAADAKAAPSTSETSSRRVSFASGTAPATGKYRKAAKATTGRLHATAASSRKKRPRPRQRHMIYGIKLSEEGMRAFSDEHFGPPPEGLTEEESQSWWSKRRGSLFAIIPRHCINRFNLRDANPSLVTIVHDGDSLRPAVAFADNSSRRTSALPSQQLVADVAKYMHQEGDKAQWYRYAKTGD